MLTYRFGPYENSAHLLCFGLQLLCILGLPFLQMVNVSIDWMNNSVQVSMASSLCPLKEVSLGLVLQCDTISAK